MKDSDIEVLNIVQQVLRHLMLALAAGHTADLGKIGAVLEAGATSGTLEPMARRMLADLAAGATGLHAAGIRKQ
jgi:hypothetical protein